MKESFRQSMLWLHSWLGITAGWLLFIVFLTGTTGFVKDDITRWMRPELPLVSAPPPASETLAVAERFLARNVADAEFWSIFFPGHFGNDELAVTWREPGGQAARAVLDLATGEAVQRSPRETGGGYSLYVMHYALHYVSRDTAISIVGAAAMMMLVSILTGAVGHKPALRDISALRSGQAAARWRSRHTLLGLAALPFFLVMTWSGLMLFLFVYMPTAQTALFPDDEATMRFNVEAYFPPDRPYGERTIIVPPSITPLPEVLARAEQLWGPGSVTHLRVDNLGGAGARVTAYTRREDIAGETRVAFDIETGAPIRLIPPRTATAKVQETIVGLHKAHFANSYLRALYVICGLAGTALVGTGLMHWTAKRKAKATARTRFLMAVVERITLAVVIGLPMGLAAYFWANRLLPTDMAYRSNWEVHAMFITWGGAFLYAGLRPQNRAWLEMCALAGAAYGLVPVLNVLTTDRHLGVTLPAGDWGLAGIDLAALAVGIFFVALVWVAGRKQRLGGKKNASAAGPTTVTA